MDLLLVLVLATAAVSDAARILGVFPIPSHSHQIVYRKFMKVLHARGHHVTLVTPDPIPDPPPHYEQIDIRDVSYSLWKKQFEGLQREGVNKQSAFQVISKFMAVFNELCDLQLSVPGVQGLANSSRHFDLLVFEWLLTPAFYGLSCKFPAPVVGISSLGLMLNGHDSIGNPSHPAYSPEFFLTYLDRMSFVERVWSAVYSVWFRYKYYIEFLPVQDGISKKHFGGGCADIADIERNVSLLLANTHPTWSFPRPNLPNVIEFGGETPHMPDPQPLPKDIKKFIESAEDGVIYFSLGSNVQSSTMPEAKRKLFLDAFRQIKQKVVWKWETDDLPGRPDNVKLGKWLPQTDILAHPKVRAFITQGGLQSMSEATHFHVPMIVIPFFADQDLNANKLESVGVAIKLDFETLTTQIILDAINQIIHNPVYKESVVKYEALTTDQPQTPMERAVWWTEYVLRHDGARHLRSPALDLSWYQYLLLDVIAFLLVVTTVLSYLSYIVLRTIKRMIFKPKAKPKKE